MLETLSDKLESSARVLAAQSGKPDGASNGVSKAASAAQNGALHIPDFSLMNGDRLSQVHSGLQFLWNAYASAQELFADPWEFSVEWPELRRLGLTCNDLRWLIRKGLVEQAHEITAMEDEHRRFVPCSSLALSRRTCLILTEEGCRLTQQLALARSAEETVAANLSREASLFDVPAVNGNGAAELILPHWDRDRRQLRIAAKIIKEFKVPAPNQEMVLGAFEEEHWPPKIDDPLPHRPGIVPQRRLHDTINSLNRRQRHRLLHFSADGLGSGVRWEILPKRISRE